MRGFVTAAVVFASLLALPSAAFAQAEVTGTVRDSSGAVLPGVCLIRFGGRFSYAA